jgi:excinuclease UvrABC nuclease subunit
MNAELKQVRQDLDCMEGNLDRVSENCKKTQSEFREMAETSENLLNHESEEVTRILELAFNDYSR